MFYLAKQSFVIYHHISFIIFCCFRGKRCISRVVFVMQLTFLMESVELVVTKWLLLTEEDSVEYSTKQNPSLPPFEYS